MLVLRFEYLRVLPVLCQIIIVCVINTPYLSLSLSFSLSLYIYILQCNPSKMCCSLLKALDATLLQVQTTGINKLFMRDIIFTLSV